MNKTIVLQKRYDRLISFIKVLSIPAAVIFIGLVASLYWFYKNLSPQNFGPEWLAVLVAGAILALGVFHLILLLALWISSRTSETPNIARSLAIALGCVSAVSLAVSAVALSDIGKQTAAGFDSSGEWTILLINNIIQFLFLVFALSSLPVFKKKSAAPFIINDDTLFITINEVGCLSALMAVCAIVFGLIYPVLQQFREAVIVLYTVISLAPWGLMLIGWFISRRKKISNWWDEKQVRDMGRAAIFSHIITVAVAVIIFLSGQLFSSFEADIIWFPSVIVTAVLSFSAFAAGFSRWG
jgi:hypothetical protein